MTFYFYDLETSGISSRAQRIMQFAGQRTDANFEPIGEPDNWLVALTDEVLPDPEAVLITKLTPQKTHEEGYSEAEFLKLFSEKVLTPDTVIAGFNTVRFDDEFMRNTLWRNFYDPYEWQWKDGRSRWDLMDVVRLMRALRPEGITWPFAKRVGEDGESSEVPTNRLELLTELNGLSHENAHDALSDVRATIAVAKLLREKQPKMFDYLLEMRDKKKVLALIDVDDPKPFVYCSGRYANNWLKTTVVIPVGIDSRGAPLVYDLRQDPLAFAGLSDPELRAVLFMRDPETESVPVKPLKPNACPAVAPLGVLDEPSQERLQLPLELVEENYKKLRSIKDFSERVTRLYKEWKDERTQKYAVESDPEFKLYDAFIPEQDRQKASVVRAATEADLVDLNLSFTDERLESLLTRYKARNYPKSLTKSEQELWEQYKRDRLTGGANGQLSLQAYFSKLAELAGKKQNQTSEAQFLLEELQLYAQSIVPTEEG